MGDRGKGDRKTPKLSKKEAKMAKVAAKAQKSATAP